MHRMAEELLKRRDRCFEKAENAPTEAIRTRLLSVCYLYEIDVDLLCRARQCIADSKELIAKTEALLSRR
jgi:hypothetical protein